MGLIGCPEMSVRNYHYIKCHNPEEHISKKYKFSDITEYTQYVEMGNEFTMLNQPIIAAYGVV